MCNVILIVFCLIGYRKSGEKMIAYYVKGKDYLCSSIQMNRNALICNCEALIFLQILSHLGKWTENGENGNCFQLIFAWVFSYSNESTLDFTFFSKSI